MPIYNYLLILLAIFLSIGIIFSVKNKCPNKKWFRRMLICIQTVVIIILLGKVIIFPDLKTIETTGKYQFTSEIIQWEDTNRLETFLNDGSFRKLSTLVYYPNNLSEDQKSPLLIFSHGGMSFETSNISLYKEFASHGYTVVSIGHTFHALSTTIDGKKIGMDSEYRNELNHENSHEDIEQSFTFYKKWMNVRTKDINFILDRFKSESLKPENEFFSNLDISKIALIGHSLGGSAVLGVARQRNDIRAVIALESPYFCDMLGIKGNEFIWDERPYTAPMLNVYSDSGINLVEEDHKYRQNKKYLINEDRVEYYYMKGSNHFTLTDMVRLSPLLSTILGGRYKKSGYETLETLNTICLKFLEKHMQS